MRLGVQTSPCCFPMLKVFILHWLINPCIYLLFVYSFKEWKCKMNMSVWRYFTTEDVYVSAVYCRRKCGCVHRSVPLGVCQNVCRRRVSGVCVEGRSILGPGNLPQMKLDSIPGDQRKQTFQSCRKSISTWWDSPPPTRSTIMSLLSPSIPPSFHPSLYHLTSPCPTPVNKATQDHHTPAVPLKPGD